jgi:beta-lactamase class A
MLKKNISEYMRAAGVKYSILIRDLLDGEEFSFNVNEKVPSASIIKLFIMLKVFELAEKNEISLSERITISNLEKVPFSIITLLDENSYTIKDLVTLMIIQSDNTATNKLIDIITIDKFNNYMDKLGFNSTILERKMMDFEARKSGKENYTSIYDVSKYLQLIYEGKLINKYYSDLMITIMKNQLHDGIMRINLPDDLIIAHKTGDLAFLKHDVGIVYLPNTKYIFSMFTWEAPSDNYARNVIGAVSKIAYDYFINKKAVI